MSNLLIRAVLKYKNVAEPDRLYALIDAVISDATSQSLYVSRPNTNYSIYSDKRVRSLNILNALSKKTPIYPIQNPLVRAELKYKNVDSAALDSLTDIIFCDTNEHNLYISSPDSRLVIYSDKIINSLRILEEIQKNKPIKEFFEKNCFFR